MAFDLPPNPGQARDQAILDHIRAGDFQVDWATILSSEGGHEAEFRVFADALKIQGVRVSVSAYLQQTIADMMGCSLLTAKLADLIFAQRSVSLRPKLQVPDASMVTTKVMVDESEWIDGQLGNVRVEGIVQTVGKHWIVDNALLTHTGKACNYGWHLVDGMVVSSADQVIKSPINDPSVTLPGVKMVQSRGFAHAAQEADYSQNCVLVARECAVDGVSKDIVELFQDQSLSSLANAGGVLKAMRQPGVPQVPFVGKQPPCVGPGCPSNVVWTPGGGEFVVGGDGSGTVMKAGIAIAMCIGGYFAGRALFKR